MPAVGKKQRFGNLHPSGSLAYRLLFASEADHYEEHRYSLIDAKGVLQLHLLGSLIPESRTHLCQMLTRAECYPEVRSR